MVKVEAQRILPRYGLEGARLRAIDTGLINRTFRVDHGDRGTFALQRLNPIFGAEVNADLAGVTEHLARAGMQTPRLVETLDGARDVQEEGALWRLLTWIEGRCFDRFEDPRRAGSAGRLLGRFHRALEDYERPFSHARLGVHDTERHFAGLREALETLKTHPMYTTIEPVGRAILEHAAGLEELPKDVERVVHGDPKASNLLFDAHRDEAICMVDLDTLARMPVVLELGDAFRSWCSTSREDEDRVRFDVDLFAAAVAGYAEGSSTFLTSAERSALVAATETICVELAARFAKDALEERYFGWDRTRFESRGAHNLVRAKNQLRLARSVRDQQSTAEGHAKAAFQGG